jgi:hypothetical protein
VFNQPGGHGVAVDLRGWRMKLSELIETLMAAKAEYGDVTVYVNDTQGDRDELSHDWVNIEEDGTSGEIIVYIG